MTKNRKNSLVLAMIIALTVFSTNNVQAQFLKKITKKAAQNTAQKGINSLKNKKVSKKVETKNSVNNISKNSKKEVSVKGEKYVSRNTITSRFVTGGTSNLSMVKMKTTTNGTTYDQLRFLASGKIVFKLDPRVVWDEIQRGKDGVYSSMFVKEGEAVYHIDELNGVIDQNGKKHSISGPPSRTKRVLKTPDNVYLIYFYDNNKKAGSKYPYFASSKSNFTGPFIIAAPSLEKFDEWTGEKALNYVKDFENRIKIGCFKFMPKEGKLHTPELAEKAKQAIYKQVRKYKNKANLNIKKIVVYSDTWNEKRDDATDEVTERELIAYYLYINGTDTDILAAKIIQKHNGSSFAKEMVVTKNYSDKFSKDIPVSLVNKYFN